MGLESEYLEEIKKSFIGVLDYRIFEDDLESPEEYEFEGFEELDLEVLDYTVATKEIYEFVQKYDKKIYNKKDIRLLAQKTT